MGYESRFYIVRKSEYIRSEDGSRKWAEMIAQFNMSKIYPVSDILRNYPKTDCYFYDGNQEVYEDLYGDVMREIPIDKLIEIVEKAMEGDEYGYWRYKPFLQMLKGFEEYKDSVVALHYGY